MKTRLLKKLRRRYYYYFSDELKRCHVFIGKKRYHTTIKREARSAVRLALLKDARNNYYKYSKKN